MEKDVLFELPLIDISDLQNYLFQTALLTRVSGGRPKKERFRKDKIRGSRGEAAAQDMAEPPGDGEKMYGHHITVRHVESEGTFL